MSGASPYPKLVMSMAKAACSIGSDHSLDVLGSKPDRRSRGALHTALSWRPVPSVTL